MPRRSRSEKILFRNNFLYFFEHTLYKENNMQRLSRYKTYEDCANIIKLTKKEGKPLVFFDLETTGLSRKTDRILSFSAVKTKWDGRKFAITERIDQFINPGFHIPAEVTRINHISDDTVAACPFEEDALVIVRNFLGEEPVLCGYNSNTFDVPFLGAAYQRVFGENLFYAAKFDVMKMVKDLCEFSSYKLSEVAAECGCTSGLVFHNSMDDVIATLRVFNVMIYEYRNDERAPNNKKPPVRMKLKGYQHYFMSHKVNRVYFSTYPYSKSFYDIYRGEWITDLENADMRAFREDALKLMNVQSETDIMRAVSTL